jgi:hypothetical protein
MLQSSKGLQIILAIAILFSSSLTRLSPFVCNAQAAKHRWAAFRALSLPGDGGRGGLCSGTFDDALQEGLETLCQQDAVVLPLFVSEGFMAKLPGMDCMDSAPAYCTAKILPFHVSALFVGARFQKCVFPCGPRAEKLSKWTRYFTDLLGDDLTEADYIWRTAAILTAPPPGGSLKSLPAKLLIMYLHASYKIKQIRETPSSQLRSLRRSTSVFLDVQLSVLPLPTASVVEFARPAMFAATGSLKTLANPR